MTVPASRQRILVPLDGSAFSSTALPWVRALSSPESEILLLRVIEAPLPMIAVAGGTTLSYEEVHRAHLDSAAGYLRDVCDGMHGTCGGMTRLARVGNVPDTILEVAAEREVDLIVMATHGHGIVGRLLLGSVADRVARAATVPVLLVHPQHEPEGTTSAAEIDRIVVPLDGSDRARAALPVAAAIARQRQAPVHVVQVVPSREDVFGIADTSGVAAAYDRRSFVAPARALSATEHRYFEGLCSAVDDALAREARLLRADGVEASAEVLIGETVPSLVSALAPGDLVVMTSHGEGGFRRWQLGSVAEKLIHQAAAPIVLVPNPERRAAGADAG